MNIRQRNRLSYSKDAAYGTFIDVSRRSLALLLIGTAALLVNAPPAKGHSYELGGILIGHVWAPPPVQGTTEMPVYAVILNRGGMKAQLLGIHTSIAERAIFRRDGNGQNESIEKIDLVPGKPMALAPWREHIWLSGLRQPLKEGDRFDLVLDFGAAGKSQVVVMLESSVGH
ncbi:MAG TPA: copper chaperone PCu(A)C [Lacipirellulaceae bacterium]|nr:copper chaperone PCu(A)C [Lacipirellulaceae bacterium]